MKKEDREQKKIIRLYSAFGASLVLMLIPSSIVAIAASVLFMGVLIAAYVLRKNCETASLCENHTTFIIRTIWIGVFLSLLTMTAASFYMLPNIDNNPLEPCAQSLISSAGAVTKNEDIATLLKILDPCMSDFMRANSHVFLIAMAISAIPVLLYFLIRFSRGLSRAIGGYRIANTKNWL